MNPDAQNTVNKTSPRKIILISLLTFILLMLAITGQFTYSVLNSDKVYKGVYIDNIDVSGLTANDLKDMLNQRYQKNTAKYVLTLKANSSTEKINYSDINVVYDVSSAAAKAFNTGRTGSIFDRIYFIVSTRLYHNNIALPVSFNNQKVEGAIKSLYTKTLIDVKDADLLIQDDKVVLRSGHHGENIDTAKALIAVENSIKTCKDGIIEFPIVNTMPNKMDVESYYNKINLDVKDAQYKVENNNVTVIPHVIGRSIDKQELIKVIDSLAKTENVEKVLPVIFVQPKLTTSEATANLFKDTLYTFNTQFYTGTQNDSNRGENIRIAVSKINGKILAPGDTFSFNDTVGNRTEDGGYKVAHTYVGGKVVDGIGGGICQVSTTLYNSVLFADLDVVDRTNHMFTIGYVPLGRDAAVSFGDVDFKFKNSTSWPLKIEGWVTNDNRIIFSLKGKNDNPGKTIEIYNSTVKALDFKTVYVDDPAVAPGIEDVKTEGMKGFVIDTFKIVKQDGKVVSEGKLHTSTYNPLDREVHRAPVKPVKSKPAAKSSPGVDDAANPPAKTT